MDSQVVIIGGGIAGLALANALAFRRISSCVIERRVKPGSIDRGDVIHAGALALLRKWGVTERLSTDDQLCLELFQICDASGRIHFNLHIGEELGPEFLMTVVRHPMIEEVLEQSAIATGMVEIKRGLTCIDFVSSKKRVVGARMQDGAVFHAPFTVVAAGACSPLEQIFGQVNIRDYKYHFYNLLLDSVPGISCAGRYYLSPEGVMIMVPLPRNLLRVGLQVSSPAEASMLRDPEKLLSEIQRRYHAFPTVPLQIREGHFYRLCRRLAKRFWIPGAAIIGDAAHTVHPTGGQGMNIAFKDADLLAEALSSLFSGQADEATALSHYESLRRPEVMGIQKKTHFLGLISESRCPYFSSLQTVFLKMFDHSGMIKKTFCKRFLTVS